MINESNTIMNLIIDFLVISGLIVGIWLFSEPRKARFGNLAAAFSLLFAFILILYRNQIVSGELVAISLLIGAIVGYAVAKVVNMNQIPAMVAIQNGAGGAAAFLVSLVELARNGQSLDSVSAISGIIGLAVGAFTFSGSLIAGAKLANKMRQLPQILPSHNILVLITIWGMFAACSISFHVPADIAFYLYLLQIVLSLLLGVLFSIRIGGADMPVLISFLNSMTGLSAALCGMVLGNRLLIAFGAVVAASGYILTYIMCKAMNRDIIRVFFPLNLNIDSKKSAIISDCIDDSSAIAPSSDDILYNKNSEVKNSEEQNREVLEIIKPFEKANKILQEANKIIIIPGYGMAIAQAQMEVTALANILIDMGKELKYAIHPVAGRMPGHMNVLLAEANVDYDMLIEMEEINPEFGSTDLAIIVGACDVVNPAAIEVEGTPISGMPILMAHEAKNIIICNFDEKPGYSGVPNPLYKNSNTVMLEGDAKETMIKLLSMLKN